MQGDQRDILVPANNPQQRPTSTPTWVPPPNNTYEQERQARQQAEAQGVPYGGATIARGHYPGAGADHYGAEMRSYILREQYRDYQRRFQPIEEQFIDDTMSTKMLDDRLSQISVNSDRAFDTAGTNAAVRSGRYGISQNPAEQAAWKRRMDYTRAMSTADARNNARTHDYDRRMSNIFGGQVRQDLSEV